MVVERVLQALADDPDRIAISDPREAYTAGRVRREAYRTGRALLARGVGAGTTVALSGRVSPRMYILTLAIRLVGAAHLDVPAALSPREQADLLAECGAGLMVIDPDQTGAGAIRALAAAPGLDLCSLSPSAWAQDLFAQASGHSGAPFPASVRHGDPCRISTTSGTTGRPKVIVRTYAPAPARPSGPSWIGECFTPHRGPSRFLLTDRLSGLPHTLADAALGAGNRLHTLPEHGVGELLSTVASERITHLYLSVHKLAEMVAAAESAEADLSSLTSVITAGSAVSPALLRRAVDRLGPVVHSLYGQTEAGNICVLSPRDYTPWNDTAARSVGRPLPGVEIRIRPDEDQRSAPEQGDGARARGRVWVRAPRLMDGYLNRPEETGRVLRDGWLDTGDVGHLDEDGRLVLLGRSADAVTVNGRIVFPSEIDAVIQEHPEVQDSATFDVSGSDGAELHTALVYEAGARPDTEGLLRRVEKTLGPGLAPASAAVVQRIPYTFSADPCRRTLRQWHAQRQATADDPPENRTVLN